MRARYVAIVAVVAASAFLLGGCSTQARAERKGKSAGVQICKAKDSNDANSAERHIRSANDKLDDLARFTGRDVREDVRDLDRYVRHEPTVKRPDGPLERLLQSARRNPTLTLGLLATVIALLIASVVAFSLAAARKKAFVVWTIPSP